MSTTNNTIERATQLHRSAKELLAEADYLMSGKQPIKDDFPVLDTPVKPGSLGRYTTPLTQTTQSQHSIQLKNQAIQPSALMQARKQASNQDLKRPTASKQATLNNDIVSFSEAYWDTMKEELFSRVMNRLDDHVETRLKNRLETDLKPVLNLMMEKLAQNVADEVSKNMQRYIKKALAEEIADMRGKPN